MKRKIVNNISNQTESVIPKATLVKWVNSGGPFYLKDGTKIPHGGNFMASSDDIPTAFRDNIRPVDPLALANSEPRVINVVLGFKLQSREGTEFVDIVDGAGKKINEKNLTADEAKTILDKLI